MFGTKQLGPWYKDLYKELITNLAIPSKTTCEYWWILTIFFHSVIKSYIIAFTSVYAWHHLDSNDKAILDVIMAGLNFAMTWALCTERFRTWCVHNKWKMCFMGALIDGPTEWLLLVSPFSTWLCNVVSTALLFTIWRTQGSVRKNAIWQRQDRTRVDLKIDRAAYLGLMIGSSTAILFPTDVVYVIVVSGFFEILAYFTSTWRFEIADRYIKQNNLSVEE